MTKTKIQKLFFAVLTVFITVHLFVFYNVAIEMGGMSNQVFVTSLKIVPIELIFALLIEIFIAGPLSEKLAFSMIDFKKDSQVIITTVFICSTIVFMCPLMSLVSTILFHGFTSELIATWFQNIVINLPFAFFTQIFFVQPFVRYIFRFVFKHQLDNEKQYDTNEIEVA